MCDSLVAIGPHRTLFAKNSDRPVGEAQVVEAFPRRPGGGRLHTQYLEIADAGAHALIGSRPVWLWGLEHGVNEHGVAIGNEKVWTRENPKNAAPALIGMDLVRLGLERAESAAGALEEMTALLEQHGQGGVAELATGDAYFSSFLVADRTGAWILETSGRDWAAREVETHDGVGSAVLSNRISLPEFDAFRHPRAPTGHADVRIAVTAPCAARAPGSLSAREVAVTMRDHGGHDFPPPEADSATGAGVSVCMHVRGYQATAASMICHLPRDPVEPVRTWAALGSPCVSVYIPVGDGPPAALADPATWARVDRLRERVEDDPARLGDIRSALDEVESRIWDETDAEAAWEQVATVIAAITAEI